MYEPCDKRLPFFEDIDKIRKYIKRFFVLPFARELEIMDSNTINELLDGEKIEDYSDINKIYKEIENNNIEDEKDEETE